MTQLGMGVAALNRESAFQAAYEKGIKKADYWTYTLEDCISLMARLPALAARIYRNVYKPGSELQAINKDLDIIGEYSCFPTPLRVLTRMQATTPTCSAMVTTRV